jgi:CSLREA domain-containing protein
LRIGAALALVVGLALPGVARADTVTLTSDPLSVTVDGLGHLDVSYADVSQLYGESWDGFALRANGVLSYAGEGDRVLDAQPAPDGLTATSSWHLSKLPQLQVDETDSIAAGSHDLNRSFTLTNHGDTEIDLAAGELADATIGGQDEGRGVLTPGGTMVAGLSANGQLSGLVENSDFPWTSFEEGHYGALQDDFGSGALHDSVDPETTDNGFAAEWDVTLAPGASRRIVVTWRFDAATRVNTTADHDDGACDANDCTLREALLYGDNPLISLPAGTYELSRELQIPGDGTWDIYGAGASADAGSVIDGRQATRLFEVGDGANVLLSGLRLQNGNGTSITAAPRRSAAAEQLVNGDGGAIAVQAGGTLTLADSEVAHNAAAAAGGGIANAGTLKLLRSTVAENVAGDDQDPNGAALGGGLYLSGADTTLLDATVGRNRAGGQGGAIAVSGGILRLASSTVAGNAATGSGGALQIGDATVNAVNTILAGDTPHECAGGQLSQSSDDIFGDGSCAPGQPGVDPQLAPLALRQPRLSDDTVQIRTFAPYTGSPAIGAGGGEDCAAAELEGMDALGQPRLVGDRCTIGAVEQYAVPAPTIAAPQDGATVPAAPIAFSGTAAPGTWVQVASEESGDSAEPVQTGADGRWTVQFPTQAPGRYTFTAFAYDDSDVQSDPSAPVTLTVAGVPAPAAQVSGTTVTLSGTAPPGATVKVLDAGTVVATVTADAGGAWTAVLTGVSPGTHSYSFVAGSAPQSAVRTVTVAATPAGTPAPTPTATPTATPTPTPPPVAGETLDTQVKSGTIKVKLPHSNRYVTLAPGEQLPVGATVDATHGRVTLLAAGGQQADFYAGIFSVAQTKGAKPLTTLRLAGPKPTCSRARTASAARKAKKKVRSRSLWGSGHGNFRTQGQYSSATVRGTTWFTQDSCAGTLTRVTAGVVQVQDFVHHRKRLVRAGHRYLARPRCTPATRPGRLDRRPALEEHRERFARARSHRHGRRGGGRPRDPRGGGRRRGHARRHAAERLRGRPGRTAGALRQPGVGAVLRPRPEPGPCRARGGRGRAVLPPAGRLRLRAGPDRPLRAHGHRLDHPLGLRRRPRHPGHRGPHVHQRHRVRGRGVRAEEHLGGADLVPRRRARRPLRGRQRQRQRRHRRRAAAVRGRTRHRQRAGRRPARDDAVARLPGGRLRRRVRQLQRPRAQ